MANKREAIPWRNRIVNTGTRPAGEFLANVKNWRIHPKAQRAALTGVLAEVGWVTGVVVNKTSGTIIDGHARIEEALKLGDDTPVPFIEVELTEDEEAKILATFDPISAMAAADKAQLDALLHDVSTADEGIQAMLSELAADNGLAYGDVPTVEDVEPEIDRAAELQQKWQVQRGDVWELGAHRLMCGDSTIAEDVARLMQGEKATLAPVDPPYNVGFDYDGATVDDKKGVGEYETFSRAWFGNCQKFSTRQIVTPGCSNLALWLRWFDAYHVAPWTKAASMTRGRVSNFLCWEPVLFFGAKWARSRANDIFHYEPTQQKLPSGEPLTGVHPCPKPLKLWLDLLEHYSEKADLIYEAFSGSGTTIMACEQLNRRCRAMEISPKYVAVALERWATATGKQPVRIVEGAQS